MSNVQADMKISNKKPVIKVDNCWSKIGVWGSQTPRCDRLKEVVHCRNCDVYSTAGRGLLERDPPPDYIDDWTALLARSNQAKPTKIQSILAFRIGDEFVAVSIGLVKEIVEMGRMHRIPHKCNNVVKGLVSIRGELRLCVSLGGLLGIKKGELSYLDEHHVSYSERLVVIVKGNDEFVFPVSEVIGIRHVDPNTIQGTPSTISNSMSSSIAGIYKIDGRNIGMLDDNKLLEGLRNKF
jgi:chemotaxis-related protein WspD